MIEDFEWTVVIRREKLSKTNRSSLPNQSLDYQWRTEFKG